MAYDLASRAALAPRVALAALLALALAACPGDAPDYRPQDGGVYFDISGNPDQGIILADGPAPRRDSGGGGKDAPAPAPDKGVAPKPDQSVVGADSGGPPPTGKPGEFSLTFSGRAYRLYVPAGYQPTVSIPILVGFHGAGDSGSNFYQICKAYGLTSAAGPARYILVVPTTKSPRSDFANWSGNPNNDIPAMKTEMDDVIALLDDIGKRYNIDRKQRHAFGFSNGGLFTAIGGFYRSTTFASLTVLGYGWGSSGYPGVTPTRKLPVQFGVGTLDQFYNYAKASAGFLGSRGHSGVLRSVNGAGHRFSTLIQAIKASTLTGWMLSKPLP